MSRSAVSDHSERTHDSDSLRTPNSVPKLRNAALTSSNNASKHSKNPSHRNQLTPSRLKIEPSARSNESIPLNPATKMRPSLPFATNP